MCSPHARSMPSSVFFVVGRSGDRRWERSGYEAASPRGLRIPQISDLCYKIRMFSRCSRGFGCLELVSFLLRLAKLFLSFRVANGPLARIEAFGDVGTSSRGKGAAATKFCLLLLSAVRSASVYETEDDVRKTIERVSIHKMTFFTRIWHICSRPLNDFTFLLPL